jgi:hypothetical protein
MTLYNEIVHSYTICPETLLKRDTVMRVSENQARMPPPNVTGSEREGRTQNCVMSQWSVVICKPNLKPTHQKKKKKRAGIEGFDVHIMSLDSR